MNAQKWKDLGMTVARIGLPTLGGMMAGGPIGAAGAAIAAAANELGIPAEQADDPDVISQAIQADPQSALKLYELNADLESQRIKAAAETAVAEYQEAAKQQAATNETMRAEIVSEDPFVRRARPFFIWIMGLSWGYQMTALVTIGGFAVYKHPVDAGAIITAIGGLAGALTTMWGVALAVVGVYFKQRSNDKARAVGLPPAGLLDFLKK